MKIVEFNGDITVNGTQHRAGARYVTNDSVAMCLQRVGARIVSDARPWLKQWRGESLDGCTLLIHASMGIGDELLAARLAKIAKDDYRAKAVKLAIFEAHHSLWAHDVGKIPFDLMTELVPLDDWNAASFHVMHEGWWESYSGAFPEQPDVWQTMELACDIAIEEQDRFPVIPSERDEDYTPLAELYGKADKLAVWILGASSHIRSYHPHQTAKAIKDLVGRDYKVLAVGHPEQVAEYGVKGMVGVSVLSAGVAQMFAAIKLATDHPRGVLVTPDSAAGHVAACYPRLPVVSLWSSFDPAKRIASYRNHIPITQRIKCSPCFAHEYIREGEKKNSGCPLTACNGYCHGLEAIKPELIVEQVVKASEGRKA
jgi:hypothetical protein